MRIESGGEAKKARTSITQCTFYAIIHKPDTPKNANTQYPNFPPAINALLRL